MFGFYTPILLLQAFCAYHAYRYNAERRWYWLILFFPGIGCLIYLYHHFYNRRSIDTLAESVKVVVNSNYKIEKLERAYKFSDSITNRVNLADAYLEIGRYDDAIVLYVASLSGFMADDPALNMKLLYAHFLNRNFTEAVDIGRKLEAEKKFSNSPEWVAYGWSLFYIDNVEEAERIFRATDKAYTNYPQRLEYCKFLLENKRTEALREKTAELLEEFEHMRGPERKFYRSTISEVRSLSTADVLKK